MEWSKKFKNQDTGIVPKEWKTGFERKKGTYPNEEVRECSRPAALLLLQGRTIVPLLYVEPPQSGTFR